jgi:Ca2+/H+ antiporter, TMEM165/GDT1 family
MEALTAAFVAALLAETGGRTQRLAAEASAHTGRPAPTVAAIALAAAAASAVAAVGGYLVGSMVTPRALTLLVALALGFAGLQLLIARRRPKNGPAAASASFVRTLARAVFIQFGEASQFLIFALAARFDAPALAGIGGTAGILAACIPAAMAGGALSAWRPLLPLRIVTGILFLLAALVTAVNALRLV